MNILFICKHNRFRSKIAEAFFNKYNRNSGNEAKSRGIIKDIDIAPNVLKVAKQNKIKLKSKKSIKLKKSDIKWAELIVIVANNVSKKDVGTGKREIIVWKIKDTSQENIKEIRKLTRQIKRKVLKLIKAIDYNQK